MQSRTALLALLSCFAHGADVCDDTCVMMQSTHKASSSTVMDDDSYTDDYNHDFGNLGGLVKSADEDEDRVDEEGPDESFPFVYVVFGPGGQALARAVVDSEDDCPSLVLSDVADADQPEVRIRATGTSELPYAFPVRVCEAELPDESSGGTFGSRKLPAVTKDPKTWVLLGDTGLRIKGNNDGTCLELNTNSHDKLYGMHTCSQTGEFDYSLVDGDFQNTRNWPLLQVNEAAAKLNPDVVIHVGDFLYRQSHCPEDQPCLDINPGDKWGDRWTGWKADFFVPSRSLLEAAPFIAVRGNHENCGRSGHGWYLFLDPSPLPDDWTGAYCNEITNVYAIPFRNEQVLVMDDSPIVPMNGGIDHMDFNAECPASDAVTADETDRRHDPDQTADDIEAQVQQYEEQFQMLKELAQNAETNIYASHRPLYAAACNGTHYVTLDWTMQQAAARVEGALDRVAWSVAGHMHWFEALQFVDNFHPAQIVVGNGGTKLIQNKVPQSELNGAGHPLTIVGGQVERGVTRSEFGFATVSSAGDTFDVDAVALHPWSHTTENYWSMSVPRGVRVAEHSGE